MREEQEKREAEKRRIEEEERAKKEIEEKENANIKNERDFPQTFQLFKEIESMMNSNTSKKSTNNRTFVFHAYSILVNSGILFEQLPHRDYPSKV